MMKWLIEVPIKAVHGFQSWHVEAETEAEAIKKWRTDNDAEFVAEEVEVTDLDMHNITATEVDE